MKKIQFLQCTSIIYTINKMQKDNQACFNSSILVIEKLISKIKPSSSTALRSAIAGLYTTDDDNPLRFSGKIGLLQLDIDRTFKTNFLRFYDLQTLNILLQLQLFYGFGENFRRFEKDTFYVFDFFHNGSIGFEFHTKQAAQAMAQKIKSTSHSINQFRQLQKAQMQKKIAQKKSSSFFGKIKKRIHNIMGDEQEEKIESVILNVEKQKSIAFNFSTGQFDLDNIPLEWQEIFDTIGLKKKDYKNKEVMKYIFEETLIHQAQAAAEKNPDNISAEHMFMIKEDIKQEKRQSDLSSLKSSVMTCDFDNSDFCFPPPPDAAHLPPPPQFTLPSPPPLDGGKIQQNPGNNNEAKHEISRADFLAQIRNNNLKLKPVKTNQDKVQIDASAMNREQRNDLAEQIRIKLQKRKLALSRREASDSEDSD